MHSTMVESQSDPSLPSTITVPFPSFERRLLHSPGSTLRVSHHITGANWSNRRISTQLMGYVTTRWNFVPYGNWIRGCGNVPTITRDHSQSKDHWPKRNATSNSPLGVGGSTSVPPCHVVLTSKSSSQWGRGVGTLRSSISKFLQLVREGRRQGSV